MGHRTFVAYDRAGFDLHYAHWGVDPADITPETPFGGAPEDNRSDRPIGDAVDPEGGRLTDDRCTTIEPDPIATGLSFREVCSHLDPIEHEALFVVEADFAVRTYLVFALRRGGDGPPDDVSGGSGEAGEECSEEDGEGMAGSVGDPCRPRRATAALVGYDDPADAAYLRGWLAGARAVRDVTSEGDDAVVRALRWLDPARGTLLWLSDDRPEDGRARDDGRRDRTPCDGRDP